MENKKCIGCGSILQIDNSDARGYARSLDNDYCQSCFRLRHYRDFKRVKAEVDDGATLAFIDNFKGNIFWVIDIMHLNQSLHTGLMRSLRNKKVVLVVNKRDLLQKSVSNNKLEQSLMRSLRDEDVELMEVMFVSALKRQTLEPMLEYLENDDCAFVGCVNAGKSSLLNALLGNEDLSVSPVASTTADVLKIETGIGNVYDTPGLSNETALIAKFDDQALVTLSPQKTIKPVVFQLYEKQTIVFGNLGAITLTPQKTVNVISYIPFPLKRVRPERMEANLALDHDFMIHNPEYKKKKWPKMGDRIDIEIFDIGFITIQGETLEIETNFDKSCEIVIRKAII
ncbi:GTPase RsgA [Erysipelothrix sp. HDW6C]|uniref:GTPase RsgA n=1 Tax=Erysipelothrix sp. HDW6C TaxID=2714930 RepID=UPI001407254F|nr:GTPase RsgA [Erysipelothrix sp. HDW6C]QIK70127.1 GTPase RsgA [Erysipelothrix sp. HDW6C]